MQGASELPTERARLLSQSRSQNRRDQVDTGCAESESSCCSEVEASEKRQQLNVDGATKATTATATATTSANTDHHSGASVSSSDDAKSRRALSIVILHAASDRHGSAATVPFRTFP